ncbi:hypothetical protein L1887_37344 [Cichorium endivia]|nr:hypothetical protein L1887_37344 [Cichorium endivia]
MLSLSNSSKNVSIFFRSKRNHILSNRESRSISITAPVPTHDQISHLILDQKSASEALHTFRWASKLPHFSHTQSTYRALVHKLCTFRHFDTIHQLLDEMPSSIGSPPDDDIFVTIIRGLGNARMVRQTINILNLVSRFKEKPTLKIYNSILDVLVKEDIDIARGFYRRKMMACGVKGDMYTFGILTKGLCMTNRISDAFKLIQFMKKNDLPPNTVIYNTLIHALCKNGKLGIGRARSLMKEIVNPNSVTFNILITAYCKEDNIIQALVMLEKCFNLGFVPDVITITKVMELLCIKNRAMEAVEVLERVEKKGGKIDVVAYNTLIKGFCKIKKVKAAIRFLKEMELKGCLPNVDTYNSLIYGFCELGLFDSALDMFNEMKRVGIIWNFDTFDILIRGYCSKGRVEDGYKILELMEDSKSGSLGHISPYNSIIYGFYKANRVDSALDFLTKMGTKFPRGVHRSREILACCEESRMGNAKKIYDEMILEGGVPSVVVYISLIRGFCEEKMIKEAFEIVDEMVKCGYVPNVLILGGLINGLCGEGKVGSALLFLEDVIERGWLVDLSCYSPLIDGFFKRGDKHKGLMLFMEMVEKGIVPDYFGWNCVVECFVGEKRSLEGNNMLEWILET